jgi:hypothetical protein
MLFVMAGEDVGVEGAQLHADEPQTLLLEPGQDGSDETALDGIWLQENEGAC